MQLPPDLYRFTQETQKPQNIFPLIFSLIDGGFIFTVHWVRNWMDGQAQRVVSGVISSW